MANTKPVKASEDRHVPTEYHGKIEPNWYCRGWNGKREKYCKLRAGFRTDHKGVGRCYLHGGTQPIKHGLYESITRPRIAQLVAKYEAMSDEEALRTFPELAAARALFTDWIERYDEITEALLAWHESWARSASQLTRGDVADLQALADEFAAVVGFPEGREADEDHPYEASVHRKASRVIEGLVDALDAPQRPRQVPDIADGHKILKTVDSIAGNVRKDKAQNAISQRDLYRIMGDMGRVVETYNEIEDPGERLRRVREGWLSIPIRLS